MKVSSFSYHAIAALLVATTVLAAGCGKKDDPVVQADKKDVAKGVPAPGLAETKAIAEEGFIYGLPLVMNYAVMNEFVIDKNSAQYKGPFNSVINESRVFTYKDTAVVTPNSDTPYSFIWMDLRAEPMVISVPAVAKGRYYSVQLTDGNTYNFGYIGSRATGIAPGDYLVVGPGWTGQTPTGIKQVFASTTPFAAAIIRTQLFNAADMPNVVEAVQKVVTLLLPLSTFLKQPAPAATPAIAFTPANTAGIKGNFFEYLSAALEFVPPSSDDQAVRAKLASIGVGPGRTFEFKDLSVEHKAAILLAMKEGDDKVDKYIATAFKTVNGWKVGSAFGDQKFYSGNWLETAPPPRRLRHLWQRCSGGGLSADACRCHRRDHGRQQA